MMNKLILTTLIICILVSLGVAQVSHDGYKSVSRYDYYTTEESVELIIWIPESKGPIPITVDVVFEFEHLLKAETVKAGEMNIFTFSRAMFSPGRNELTVSYMEDGKWVDSDKLELLIMPEQYNAVKIDRVSGGLVVEGLPFYPFGFYAYSPVQPGLPEEEAVKGFNMISPYQKIEGKTLKERKKYMDRCAALGMKVNYNVLSLAGGGGVGSNEWAKKSERRSIEMLKKEIETFKDHPALLSWYISDEPVGQGVSPESLEEIYGLIKETDPYHPVTIVFMTPHMAKNYSHVMDIVMADPYVIPDGEVEEVGTIAARLQEEFFMEKPVWIVPQAFGGNEWWEREPTAQELRSMTYVSLVNDAMGIQYFIRHGLNSFPKSTAAWNECGNMALEFAEMTPYLFSPDPVKELSSEQDEVQLKGFHKDGAFLVVAVNTSNTPLDYSFTLGDLLYNGSAAVWFENRRVEVRKGRVEDIIDAYGTRVYEIRYRMPLSKGGVLHNKNLIIDPSFEDVTGLGIPASCYARPGNDRGATYFIDPRTSIRGSHSIRMTAPDYGGGMSLSFKRARIEPGQSYTLSIYARALPLMYRDKVKRGLLKRMCGCGPAEDDHPEFHLSMGDNCKSYFLPDGEWREYSFSCVPEVIDGKAYISPGLELYGKGTAWFDLIQMYPDMDMKSFVTRENNDITIRITSSHKGAKIYYTTDGTEPDQRSEELKGNFKLSETATVKAAAFKDGLQVGFIKRRYVINYATGRYVEYKHKYSSKYDAGMKDGLVDGILASSDFKDQKWQGFEGDDLYVTINLKDIRKVNEVQLGFLNDPPAWIFLPEEIKVYWSADGVDFEEFDINSTAYYKGQPEAKGYNQYTFFLLEEYVEARYIRVHAKNIGVCPEGHRGAGGKAWLFIDEIQVSFDQDLADGILRMYR